MKFTRLKLHGFKSFCDHTELHLEPGLSGVVGPNGCGKSNLVEALRWVMGESSYKAMRAAGMDDVIFSGSGHRPSRNSAEVTLVLDNSDRSAPAPLNTADVLEVTRRIEREAGSVYRVNGREVRARDVQLLFADASTGAHSPALVRQGQIGELIAAKPVQRRALLEEAAGISGLHSRRHEAELRLRGAEQNLERVDDIVAQVEAQLEQLRRQARQAVRYRTLSADIRKAEAALFHLRWVAARVAEKEAEAAQGRLVLQAAEATHTELEAQKTLFLAERAVQPLRDREAAAGAALQRLIILAEQIAEEARHAAVRQRELEGRAAQIGADAARERALLAEAETALADCAAEQARLTNEAEADKAAHEEAQAAAEAARQAVLSADAASRNATEQAAQARARSAQARRNALDAASRIERLVRQVAEVDAEAERLTEALGKDTDLAARLAALETARAAAAAAEEAALGAEVVSAAALAALEAERPRMREVETALSRVESESDTLSRLLRKGGAAKWPAILDALTVVPGYEKALGAALGADLEASSEPAAPLHWAGASADPVDPPLPDGAVPLREFVSGTDRLERRLAQIGVVEPANGPRLALTLKAGQRLVTRDGHLWRWDGFTAGADAPSAAAELLAQRNRLAEVDAEAGRLRVSREAAQRSLAGLTGTLDAARQEERTSRDRWREAQRAIALAQAEVDRARKAAGDMVARQSALIEAKVRLASSLAEAEGVRADAEKALVAAENEADTEAIAQASERTLALAREQAEQARIRLSGFETATRMRAARIGQLTHETANWKRRGEAATAQISVLEARSREVDAQIAAAAASPQQFETRTRALDVEIEGARRSHGEAMDALALAQDAYRSADKAQRAAAEALSLIREQLGRLEERLKGLGAQRHQIERLVHETLGIDARQTAEAAGIRPEHALPDEAAIEQKLERLKSERERLGAVNLMAEREAEEVREKLDTMVKDRDDLISAIAKLRQGIQSLNREGRARLTEAFDKVNAHFQQLFTTLFGGGTAELSFVESDDPLEAGLEIIARPPGKKPATMTLLSGGEQALTALSLIFAVFLTNPAPICVLDEVDAPLDDANVERFCALLNSMRQRTETRFLVITHNPITMSRVDRLFGVTMAERGVSQLVSVDLTTAESYLEAV